MPRIQVHDFSGHPFQAELARELARRGFEVEHVHSAQYASGKGKLALEVGDPATLSFATIDVPTTFEKYSPWGRIRFERAYAKAWKQQLEQNRPDLVVACNVPLLALNSFRAWAARKKLPWILWHQDIFSLAMGDELERRFPKSLTRIGRSYFVSRERKAVFSATRVVAIGDEFAKMYASWGIARNHFEVIPNWAPVDDIKPVERENPWADERLRGRHGLRLLYAGMLGRKHNPRLLVDLLDGLRATGCKAELVVVSEGEGADELRAAALDRVDSDITVLPFQSATDLPHVLGAGDVLVAILEPEASKFSIPSKVLSYLAAGRPILGLMPAGNPAAQDIAAIGGSVANPDDAGITSSVRWLQNLCDDAAARERIGWRARQLAEEKFGIAPITDRFVGVIESAMGRPPS